MIVSALGRGVRVAAGFAALGLLMHLLLPDARVVWAPHRVGRLDDVLPLALVCVGETLRQRRPVLGLLLGAAGLVLAPLVGGSVPVVPIIAVSDLVYLAVLNGSRRVSQGLVCSAWGVVVVGAVTGLVVDGPGGALRVTMSVAGVLVPVVWARDVRQQRELAEHERARAEQARHVAELDRAAAVASERARMARDLHDVVAGQLSGIAVQSEAALSLPGISPEILRRVLADVRRDSVAALTEMRAMIALLRDATVDPPAAPAGLAHLDALLRSARSRGLVIELADHRHQHADVPAAVDLAAYRIVQEALANAAKHAPRSLVRLTLHDGEALVVEAENDLVPTPASSGGTGTGLLGLRERAAAVGGRIVAGPVGARWSLRAELPIGRFG